MRINCNFIALPQQLADLVVTTGKIADLGVTTGKIADLGVTNSKIGANQIHSSRLSFGISGITTVNVAAGSALIPTAARFSANALIGTCQLEINDGGSWRVINSNNVITEFLADGVNIRFHCPIGHDALQLRLFWRN